MVYRPSYTITSWDNEWINIDSEDALEKDTWVYVNGSYLKVTESKAGGFKYSGTVTGLSTDSIVINLGVKDRDYVPSLLGGKTHVPSFASPNSLVFAAISEKEG
jgi:hypothetical protein